MAPFSQGGGLALALVLTAGSPPAAAWEFHGVEIPDRFSFHEIPYPCQTDADCCDVCTCESGQCYFTDEVPLFLDYTSRSSSQFPTGLCYWYAPFHAFQTLNAYKQDALFADPGSGGFEWPWHVLGRGIRLSISPQFQCSYWAGSVNFLLGAGTVESCVEGSEAYDNTPVNECGHYDRYRTQVINSSDPNFNRCSRLQRQSQQVLAYQPTGARLIEDVRWELHEYCGLFDPSCMFVNSPAGQYYLAKTLLERGPFWTNVRWGGVFVPGTPDFEVQCDLSDLTYEGHVVAVIGYDFSDPDTPFFFIQNSHNTDADKKVYKINFEAWAPDCWFGDSIGYWEGVKPAAPWSPTEPAHPFRQFAENGDLDLDGIPDTEDEDIDGDGLFNRWDCDPYNPFLYTDLDRDMKCDNQFRTPGFTQVPLWCEAHCASIDRRPDVNFDLASCEARCDQWDRCMTTQINNRVDNDTGCTWHCLDEDLVSCDPEAELGTDYPCCTAAERADLQRCEATYKNWSNIDTDEDNIADVCEPDPTVSELQLVPMADDQALQDGENHWILLQGDVVQVAEMGLGEILKCVLGVACTRTGVVEAFRMDGAGGLTLAGTYPANAQSVPYLRWSGRHAYAMEGKKLTVLAAGAIQ